MSEYILYRIIETAFFMAGFIIIAHEISLLTALGVTLLVLGMFWIHIRMTKTKGSTKPNPQEYK